MQSPRNLLALLAFALAACADTTTSPTVTTTPLFKVGASNVIKVPGDYPTIQEAVDNASPGNEILVQGNHIEDVVVATAGLRIRAVNGGALEGGIGILADNVGIEGLDVHQSGFAPIGIYAVGRRGIEVKNNTFNGWTFGVQVHGVSPGTEVKNNLVTGSNVGIWLDIASGVFVSNNSVPDFSVCGIWNIGLLTANTFKNNRTTCTVGL